MPPTSNVERVLSLMMTLASRRRGFTRAELFNLIPGYDGAPRTVARQFERDLQQLRAAGFAVQQGSEPFDPATVRYSAPAADTDSATTAVTFTAAQKPVIAAALSAWDSSSTGGIGSRIRAKLLSHGIEPATSLLGRTDLRSAPAATALLEAVLERRTAEFAYRTPGSASPQRRIIEPWLVGAAGPATYVYGFDLVRRAPRLFRLSRITSTPKLGRAADEPRPAAITLEEVLAGTRGDDAPVTVLLEVEPFKALTLRDRFHASAHEPTITGMIRPTELRRAVLAAAPWVHLPAGGPAAVEDIRAMVALVHTLHEGEADLTPSQIRTLPKRTLPKQRSLATGATEAARLAAEAQYAQRNPGAAVEDMAAHFGITEAQLQEDLTALMFVGDYSAGYSDLIVTSSEDGVHVERADALQRPLTLTPLDASALLLGLDLVDADALGLAPSAVASTRKVLASVAGEGSVPAAEAGAGPTAPSDDRRRIAEMLTDAQSRQRPVVIRYSPPDARGTSVRRIRPRGVTVANGAAYVTAFCESAGAERRFRTDRIVEAWADADASPEPTAIGSGAREDDGTDAAIEAGLRPWEKAAPIWLRLDPAAQWILEAFTVRDERQVPGEQEVIARITSSSQQAIVTAVLEAAGAAEALHPPELRERIRRVSESVIGAATL